MTKWRTLNRYCYPCNRMYDGVLFDLDTENPNDHVCEKCGAATEARMHAPAVMTASYPDGAYRKDIEGLKRRANLECDKLEYKEGSVERERIEKEINSIN